MNPHPVGGAIWYIETHLGSELSLAEIANFVKVSRFHLLRAFGAATGLSVMSYVRARRLTEAARQLACGAADILGVAIGAGYASHEAFTRAFREQFGRRQMPCVRKGIPATSNSWRRSA